MWSSWVLSLRDGKEGQEGGERGQKVIRSVGRELPFPGSSPNPSYVMWAVSSGSEELGCLLEQLCHRKLQAKRREGGEWRRG